jgi:ribose transport system ATP-binding protein
VATVADRAIVLRDGANAGTLAHGELTHDNMISLMVGRQIDLAHDPASAPQEGSEYFRVDGLRTRRYPQHAVSFTIGRGEIVGMAGLVGAGRSEIALALFGIDPPIAGTVSLGGQPLQIETPEDAIRHGIFLVPEDRRVAGLVVDFSIRENVSLPALGRYARHGLVSETEERRGVAAICGQLQVRAQSMEVTAGTLSGGNQQKVVLAKWLALGPQVLVIDEPTRGIDVGAKFEIYQLIRQLAARGAGVLVISSEIEELIGICDRLLVMGQGMITAEFRQPDFNRERILAAALPAARTFAQTKQA